MKKIILGFLVGLALLLNACGGGSSSNSNDSSNEGTTNIKLETMAVVSGHYNRDYWNEHFSDVVFADTNNWATLTKTLPFNEKMVIDLGLESGSEEDMAKHDNPSSILLRYWYKNKGYIYLKFKNQNGTTIHTFKFDKSGHHDSGYIEFDGDIHNDSIAEFRSSIQGFIRIENAQLKFIGEYNNRGDHIVGISSKTWNISRFNEIKEVEISIKVLHTYEPSGEARIPLYIEYQERNDNQNSVNNPPTVNAGEDKSVIVNEPITITGIANDSDGEIVAYEWKEGNRLLATTASFEYLPTTTGTHTLTLTVTDNDGVTTSDSLVVTVNTQNQICDNGSIHFYSIHLSHPSSDIYSNNNKVDLEESCLKNKHVEVIKNNNIGTFKNQPDKYDIYDSTENRPPNGYTHYDYYSQTQYNGLTEKYMYASDTFEELILNIQEDIENGNCKHVPGNYYRGNLNRDDNIWTYFCPKEGLIDFLTIMQNQNF